MTTFNDGHEPTREYTCCPHCGYVDDSHKFIVIDGSLECPECCEAIEEPSRNTG